MGLGIDRTYGVWTWSLMFTGDDSLIYYFHIGAVGTSGVCDGAFVVQIRVTRRR